MSFISEFRTFILRGNAVEMAIGIVIGAAFNAVVNSLVQDIIMGAIATAFGKPDLSSFAYGAIKWGSFLNMAINLLIIGFTVFVVIKVINKLARRETIRLDPETK